ncbi:MAG: hypothetical protein JW950_04585 [Deltaproteobacteria bacterium]|nr:hypothetical protein [Deltaproteobacteria bacterium]
MDTDDLTEMTYEIITRAGDVLDVLSNEIGASDSDKKTEEDFLRDVLSHLRKIQKPREYLDWNYLDQIDVRVFYNEVARLLAHVEIISDTPYRQRGKPALK